MDTFTLAGMSRKRILYTIITTVVLSAVLSVVSFGQSVSPATEPQSAQQAFHITPVRPIAELRAEALKTTPPEEKRSFERVALIELTKIDSSIHLDIRYATSNNFVGEPVYEQARAFLQGPAAYALRRVSEKLHTRGYGLLVYDAYRPWYVTKLFWEATPVDKREFVGDPAQGSRHNRGCAVDLTLYDLKTGAPVAMPSGYDEMTPRAYATYAGGSMAAKEHRALLRAAMESENFFPMPEEWWHYDYKDWQGYEILNLAFDRLPTPIYQTGPGVVPPKILKRVDPDYSEEGRQKGAQGTVVLSLVVDENGLPRDIRVERPLGYGMDEEAIATVKRWKFKPAQYEGKAVPVMVQIEMSFHLGHWEIR